MVRRSAYCLFCYAPMERIQGASAPCPECGEVNLREDRRTYWTRERRLVRLEGELKMWAVIVSLAIAFPLLFIHRGSHGFAGVGYAAGAPIVVGFILWDAATLVTARRSLLRHDLIWPLMPITLVLGPFLLFGGISLIISSNFNGFEKALAYGVPTVVGLLAVAGLASLWLRAIVKRLGRRRETYLSRRIDAAHA